MAELLGKLNLSNDQKKQFNKIKHDLESYRELILLLNSLVKWEKKFYPGVIFGVVSMLYLILWYMDFSILTLLSMVLLTVTVIDYFYPILSKFVFKNENWSGVQEKKFEEICYEILSVKLQIVSGFNYVFLAKEERNTVFTVIVATTLVVMAWIGATINNLFLSYLIFLLIAFYPGLAHNGFVEKVVKQVVDLVGCHFKNLISKSKDVKAE